MKKKTESEINLLIVHKINELLDLLQKYYPRDTSIRFSLTIFAKPLFEQLGEHFAKETADL